MKNHYRTLGVRRSASPEEIKASYRQLAKRLHPDLNQHRPAAAERFKEVQEAYQILSDKYKRASYDLQLFYPIRPKVNRNYSSAKAKQSPQAVNWAEVFRKRAEAKIRREAEKKEEERRHRIAIIWAVLFMAVIPGLFMMLLYLSDPFWAFATLTLLLVGVLLRKNFIWSSQLFNRGR